MGSVHTASIDGDFATIFRHIGSDSTVATIVPKRESCRVHAGLRAVLSDFVFHADRCTSVLVFPADAHVFFLVLKRAAEPNVYPAIPPTRYCRAGARVDFSLDPHASAALASATDRCAVGFRGTDRIQEHRSEINRCQIHALHGNRQCKAFARMSGYRVAAAGESQCTIFLGEGYFWKR